MVFKTILNDGMSAASAYWVKDDAVYPIRLSHIRAVLDDPALFGLNRETLVTAFKKEGEKIGFEGRARHTIIEQLVLKGWIRVRHHTGRADYWSITAPDTKEGRCSVDRFLSYARQSQAMHPEDRVEIEWFFTVTLQKEWCMRFPGQIDFFSAKARLYENPGGYNTFHKSIPSFRRHTHKT